jgi:hypothetical protein
MGVWAVLGRPSIILAAEGGLDTRIKASRPQSDHSISIMSASPPYA